MKKRILSLLLSLLLLFSCTPGVLARGAGSSYEIIEGGCGPELWWSLDLACQQLTISGSGPMYDFEGHGPWYNYTDSIMTVEVCEGVTSVGAYAFADLSVWELDLPYTLEQFPISAVEGCSFLVNVNAADGGVFYSVEGVLFERTDLGDILRLYPAGRYGEYTVSDTVWALGDHSFRGCTNLTELYLSENLSYIGEGALLDCSWLTQLVFCGGVPETAGAITNISPEHLTVYYTEPYAYAWEEYLPTGWNGYPVALYTGEIPWQEGTVFTGSCGDSLTWSLDPSEGVLSISGSGAMWDFYDGCPGWFEYSDSIRYVMVGEGALSVGAYAFAFCSALEGVSLPATVESVSTYAFEECPLLNGIYAEPGPVYYSDDGVLFKHSEYGEMLAKFPRGLGLNGYYIPEYVSAIGERAFANCVYLEAVVWPESLEYVGNLAFEGCTSLEVIVADGGIPETGYDIFCGAYGERVLSYSRAYDEEWGFYDGWFWNECSVKIAWSSLPVESGAGENLSWSFDQDERRLTISGTGPMYDFIDTLPPWYDMNFDIKDVVIEDGVTSIGAYSFYEIYTLDYCRIPDTVTSIGTRAFYFCDYMQMPVIPASVEYVGSNVTYYGGKPCSVLFLGDVPESISPFAFGVPHDEYGELMTDSVTVYYCPDESSSWDPYGYGTWGMYLVSAADFNAGSECWVDSAQDEWGEAYTVVYGSGEMEDRTIETSFDTRENLIISKAVTGIGDYAFCGMSTEGYPYSQDTFNIVEDLVIHDYITHIGAHAFENAYDMSSLDIGEGVIEIGECAFANAASLQTIAVDPDNPAFTAIDNVLFDKDVTRVVRAAAGMTGDYTVPDTVTAIDAHAFDFTGLTSIEIGPNVAEIGEGAFAYSPIVYCAESGMAVSNLAAINVEPENAHYASQNGVLYNKSMTQLIRVPAAYSGALEIPEGVLEIADGALFGCMEITSVTLPSTLERIGEKAFGFTHIEELTVPASVSEIADMAFDGSWLLSVTFEGDVPAACGRDLFFAVYDVTVYYYESHASSWAPNGETEWQNVPIVMIEDPVLPQTGDVNGDGVVTASDISVMFAFILNTSSLPEGALSCADMNGDGTVDTADASLLAQMVFGN